MCTEDCEPGLYTIAAATTNRTPARRRQGSHRRYDHAVTSARAIELSFVMLVYYIVLPHTILYVMLCYAMLLYVMLCYVMLRFDMS